MNEYQGYNVNELLDMTSLDNADALDDIGIGWANAALVLGEFHEALTERMHAIKDKWTSASSGPYFTRVTETMAFIERAKLQADGRAEAVGKVASTARWAKANVATQYKEYLKASLKNTGEQIAEATDPLSGMKKAAEDPWGTFTGTADDGPTEAEIRKPFDDQARKYMKIAAEEYTENKPAIDSEVKQVKPVFVPDGDWSDGQDSWAGDGGSGSNTSDMAGLSAVSFGGNALGSAPELQSGATHAPLTPSHSGPVNPGVPSGQSTGLPVNGAPPFGGGKSPSAPPKLPNGPMRNARNTLVPRGTTPARTTPSLPGRGAGGPHGRNGPMGPQVRANGRNGQGVPNGARNRWAGRGLQRSQMEPVNRVGQPRKAGEVMGARNAKSAKPGTDTSKTAARRVQPTVVRGAKTAAKTPGGKKSPVDNTKRGFSSRVINGRDRISEANGHSRTPLVGKKLDTTAKPEPIGKRPEPKTDRSKIRAEIDAVKANRQQRRQDLDGLSRPVIDNGVTNTVSLDAAIPTQREAVKTTEVLWQPRAAVVPDVIGKRQWDPDLVDHDPGPVVNARLQARRDFEAELEARVAAIDPGPTAFNPKRQQPDASTWPGA